jgi:proton-dependent oligopeptide transporter, POT family
MTDATDKSLGIVLARVSTLEEKKMAEDHAGSDQHEEYIPNSENVTQHEFNTLRHVGDRLPMAAWLVVFVEFAERLVAI